MLAVAGLWMISDVQPCAVGCGRRPLVGGYTRDDLGRVSAGNDPQPAAATDTQESSTTRATSTQRMRHRLTSVEVVLPHPNPPGDDRSRTEPVKSACSVPPGRLLTEPGRLLDLAGYRVGVRTGRVRHRRALRASPAAGQQIGNRIVGLVIFLGLVWLFILTTVVLNFAGIWRRRTAWRWQGTGILIMNGVVLVNSYEDARGGPYPRTPFHSFTWPIFLTGFVLLGIGLVIQARGPRRTRWARHSGE